MKRLFSLALVGILGAMMVQLSAMSSVAASGTLTASDSGEIATSYDHLTTDFYKKVDPQNVLDGVHTALQAQLKKAGIKKTLPPLLAGPTGNANLHAIDHQIDTAAKLGGAKIGAHALTYGAIDGMMKSVHDRWTVFLTPKEYAALNQGLDGSDFGGTGIVIQTDSKTKYIAVSNVVPDAPADKAGVQQDDLITAINGVSTRGMSLNAASAHLRGKAGTTVSITIERDGKVLAPITLTRAKIHQLSVYPKMLPGKIGYVAVTVFGKDTGAELTTALDRLQQEGARAIIMDLRDNGGGYLDAAVAVSSKFIPSGPIVSVESRASSITTLEADATAIPPMPLAVLVNQYTASASEITSGAIQDSDVGTIIGTKTFGKGVVQTIFPLPDRSAVKITTARYLTPHNRNINHLGITPDIVLPENKGARFGDPAKDAQLRRAMQFVDGQLAKLSAANGE